MDERGSGSGAPPALHGRPAPPLTRGLPLPLPLSPPLSSSLLLGASMRGGRAGRGGGLLKRGLAAGVVRPTMARRVQVCCTLSALSVRVERGGETSRNVPEQSVLVGADFYDMHISSPRHGARGTSSRVHSLCNIYRRCTQGRVGPEGRPAPALGGLAAKSARASPHADLRCRLLPASATRRAFQFMYLEPGWHPPSRAEGLAAAAMRAIATNTTAHCRSLMDGLSGRRGPKARSNRAQ